MNTCLNLLDLAGDTAAARTPTTTTCAPAAGPPRAARATAAATGPARTATRRTAGTWSVCSREIPGSHINFPETCVVFASVNAVHCFTANERFLAIHILVFMLLRGKEETPDIEDLRSVLHDRSI